MFKPDWLINFMIKNQSGFKIYDLRFMKWISKNKVMLLILVIFLFELFLRFYQMNLKNPFGYDQVDNAWAAKNLIVNNQFPFVGMVAKANSGIFIGPAYYYIVAFFYWIFDLHPAASLAISVATGIFTFWVIFYVSKKLFSMEFAIIALLLNSFNFKTILFDGIQWPVQLLPAISLIIFYLLYKVILGDIKKLIPLAIFVGFAFNLHFTAIFFPIIIILSLPLFPRKKETFKYIFLSLPFFIIWLIPNIIYLLTERSANSTATSYLSTYYHGFHLKRMLQITGDAIIQFDPYLVLDKIKPLKILILPLFFLVYWLKTKASGKFKFLYLIFLWFMVPWIVFTTYSGEISDYYFIINRFIVLIILSYFIYLFWNVRYIAAKGLVIIFLVAYSIYGFVNFIPYKDPGNLYKREQTAKQAVNEGKRIEFGVGVPESYLYYYYMRQKGIEVYVSKDK